MPVSRPSIPSTEAADPDTFWVAVFENPQYIVSLARELDAFLALPNEQRFPVTVTYCRKDPPRGSLRPVPVRDMTQWADLGSRTGEMRKRLISLCPEGSLACYYTASESEQEVQCLGEMMLCVCVCVRVCVCVCLSVCVSLSV